MAVSTKTLTVTRIFHASDSISQHVVQVKNVETVLEALNANKISIPQACGGNGTCLTCRFVCASHMSHFSEKTDIESQLTSDRGFKENERLSCQTYLLDDSEIEFELDEEFKEFI